MTFPENIETWFVIIGIMISIGALVNSWYLSRTAARKDAMAELYAMIDELKENRAELETRINAQAAEIVSLKSQVEQLTRGRVDRDRQIVNLTKQITQRDQKILELTSEVSSLRTEVGMLRKQQGGEP
jgi:predicted RNase H-like nuclease (RuvC/YqgF family)